MAEAAGAGMEVAGSVGPTDLAQLDPVVVKVSSSSSCQKIGKPKGLSLNPPY